MDMDIEVPKLANIPEVQYDHHEPGPEGPDTFARHHAPVTELKENLKLLKIRQKDA